MVDQNKEAIMLSKMIVGIAGLITVAVFPPILLIGIVGWASWTLWNNYNEKV